MYSTLNSLLNLKVPAEERYSVIQSQGPFEIRLYQRMICAQMSLTGPYEEVIKIGSRYLNEYFEGNNFKVEKVESSGCFFQIMKENIWELGIILPASATLKNAPKPINRMIRVIEIPPTKIASLSFRGQQSRDLFIRRAEDLKRWMEFKHLNMKGPLRIIRVAKTLLPLARNYEVQFEIF